MSVHDRVSSAWSCAEMTAANYENKMMTELVEKILLGRKKTETKGGTTLQGVDWIAELIG